MRAVPATTAILAIWLATGLSPSVAQTSVTTSPADPLGSLFRGLGNIVDAAFSPKDREFKQLIENKKYREAADYYDANHPYFNQAKGRHTENLKTIAQGLNQQYESSLVSSRDTLSNTLTGSNELTDDTATDYIGKLVSGINVGTQHLATYDQIGLLKEKEFRSSHAVEVTDLLVKAKAAISERAPMAFALFDHFSGNSFFSAYPITSSHGAFLTAHLASINEKLTAAEPDKIDTFLRVYGRHLPVNDKHQIAQMHFAAVRRNLSTNAPLTNALKLHGVAHHHNIQLETPVFQIIEIASEDQPSPEFALEITNDIRASISKASLQNATTIAEASDSPLTIFVRLGSIATNRSVLSRQEVNSRFLSGTRSFPNPDYEVARQRYLQAENSYRQSQFRNSITPAQNWAQVIVRAVGETAEAVMRNKAFQEFQNTSTTLSEPVFQSYSYSVSEIEVVKTARAEVNVLDPKSRQVWRFEKDFSESKKFSLSFNVKENDENIASINTRYNRESEIGKFEALAVQWPVTNLVDTAKEAESTAMPVQSLASALQFATVTNTNLSVKAGTGDSSPHSLVTYDPRLESVVVVLNPKGPVGTGFFVEPNLIITNFHVIEGAGFAEVKLKNGRVIYGKIIKSDPGRDLALIQVTDAGVPLRVAAGVLTVGQAVEALGHPAGLQFSLTRGVVSAIRKIRFPDQGDVLMIQMDAPMSPGNSGGPLFAGGQVIGINTMKHNGKGAEGLGFALHATEVETFLSRK